MTKEMPSYQHMDLRRVVRCETLVDPMNGYRRFFNGVVVISIPSMRESHLSNGASNFAPRKLRLKSISKIIDLWYLMEKMVVLTSNPKDLIKHKVVSM